MTEEKAYYSKLLLFGEYSVICDSMGLTVPLKSFSASWRFKNHSMTSADAFIPDQELVGFLQFLEKTKASGSLLADLDLKSFKDDLEKGLFFESNIPQGFGVGSSGALCAAVYERYAMHPVRVDDGDEELIVEIKEQLAQMESHFHGVSSGLDPLLCYLQRPLLIKNKREIAFARIHEELHYPDFSMFLIDTGVVGKTGPLVNRFFDQCRQHSFYSRFNNDLIPANNSCIRALVDGNVDLLFEKLPVLSGFFYEHFAPMIPEDYRPVWQHGLSTGDFYLKLCGSGGGGFLLGFTRNPQVVQSYFNDNGIEMIPL
jgi:mevalonate kinase